MEARGGMCTIGSNNEVEGDFDLFGSVFRRDLLAGAALLEPGDVLSEIGTCELVVEVKCHIGQALKDVQHSFVEARSIDCMVVLDRDEYQALMENDRS